MLVGELHQMASVTTATIGNASVHWTAQRQHLKLRAIKVLEIANYFVNGNRMTLRIH